MEKLCTIYSNVNANRHIIYIVINKCDIVFVGEVSYYLLLKVSELEGRI